MEAVEAAGAKLLFKGGDDYPKALEGFDDAPPALFARGTTAQLSLPSIAVVDTRNASINTLRLVQTLSKQLAPNGYVVVSGLARGIDAAAYNGELARLSPGTEK